MVKEWAVAFVLALLAAAAAVFAVSERGGEETPPLPAHSPCEAALAEAEAAGLALPPGWDYRCPGNTDAGDGRSPAAGVACGFPDGCPDGAGPYIAISPARTEAAGLRLACVVAHETAHALDYEERGTTTEASATARAAAAGFSAQCQGQP